MLKNIKFESNCTKTHTRLLVIIKSQFIYVTVLKLLFSIGYG